MVKLRVWVITKCWSQGLGKSFEILGLLHEHKLSAEQLKQHRAAYLQRLRQQMFDSAQAAQQEMLQQAAKQQTQQSQTGKKRKRGLQAISFPLSIDQFDPCEVSSLVRTLCSCLNFRVGKHSSCLRGRGLTSPARR